MCPGDQLDDAEAETDAAGLAGQPLIDAVEAPEDPPLLARRDADAVVLHLKRDAIVLAGHADHDPLVVRRVLHRVVEQVDERCHHGALVGEDRWQIGCDVDLQVAVGRHTFADRSHGGVHDGRGCDCREHEPLAAALESREGEEVLDQAREPRVLTGQQVQVLARLRFIEWASSSRPSTSTRIDASGVRSSCDTAATRSVLSRAILSCRRKVLPVIDAITIIAARPNDATAM